MKLLCTLPLMVVFVACAPIRVPPLPAVPTQVVGGQISRDEATAELDTLLATFESVHPEPYAHRTAASIESERQRLLDELPPSLSRVAWWKRIAPLVANLGDPYTVVYPPAEEIRRERGAGALLFPVRVSVDGDRHLIAASFQPAGASLAAGDRVLSINGFETDALVAEWMDLFGGARDQERAAAVASMFADLLTLEGIEAPYTLRVASADGREHDVTVDGMTQEAFSARLQAQGVDLRPPQSNLAYRLLDPQTAYVEFRSMGGALDRFEKDAAAVFHDIARDRPGALIIDLRRNPGGDSRMADELLRYITAKPYRTEARKEWRMSAEYKSFLNSLIRPPLGWLRVQYLVPMGRKLLLAPDGSTVTLETEPRAPKPAQPFFSGAVCFLTGPGTSGSAVMLADAIKTYRLATLVGQETGAAAGGFGEAYTFRLPQSHLAMQVSSARFVRANGDANDTSGVRPDIEVHPEPGHDAALERARQCPRVE